MKTKLTLTIEQNVIKKAKDYAKSKDRSLSDIIENYLKLITRTENNFNEKISNTPLTDSLVGVFKEAKKINHNKELLEALEEKYL